MSFPKAGLGYQPPARYARGGRLRFHAVGCWVDGGEGLPKGVCRKCADSVVDRYYRNLMRLDQRTSTA